MPTRPGRGSAPASCRSSSPGWACSSPAVVGEAGALAEAAHPRSRWDSTAVVQHTQVIGGASAPRTTLGVTVLAVRKGTQEELAQGGVQVDSSGRSATPYYVDVRYANRGTRSIARDLDVGLENQNGDLITATTIISLGRSPFDRCPSVSDGELRAGPQLQELLALPRPKGERAEQGELPSQRPR